MFNQLGDLLKSKYIIVRFDYTIINSEKNWTKAFPLNSQADMLKAVHEFIISKFDVETTESISHSMGCIVTALAKIKRVEQVLLLAGPPNSPYKGLTSYFSQRPDTKIAEDGLSEIKRSDGSITYVPKEFWSDLKEIGPAKEYTLLAKVSKTIFVRALGDQVITDTNYSHIKADHNIQFVEIKGNHDFEGNARKELIGLLRRFFL